MKFTTMVFTSIFAIMSAGVMANDGSTSLNSGANATSNSGANSGSASQSGAVLNYSPTYEASKGVNYSGSYTIKNTPEASAPPLTAGMNTCMGSSSAGGSGPGFGISVGSTWEDEGCTRRNYAGMMHEMGYEDAARNMLCQDDNVRAAFALTPNPCPAEVASVSTRSTQSLNGPVTKNESFGR